MSSVGGTTWYDALLQLAASVNWRRGGRAKDGTWYGPGAFKDVEVFDRAIRGTGVEPTKRLMRSDSCYFCGQVTKLTDDHIVPKARGGSHGPQNWGGLCGRCNSSKNDIDFIEWSAYQGRTLASLDSDVVLLYTRNMYALLSSEESLDTPAPGTICFVLAQFAASLPTEAHSHAFNRISAAPLQQMAGSPVGAG